MNNQLNTPVKDVTDQLIRINNTQGKEAVLVYRDDVWEISAYVSNWNLSFNCMYNYKNGKAGCTSINVSPNKQVVQTNTEVKVRKDLLEKIEAVVNEFHSKRLGELNKAATDKKQKMSKLVTPALFRHYDELDDSIVSMGISDQIALGLQFVNADVNNAQLVLDNPYSDSGKFVLERRIRGGFFNIIEEMLKQMRDNNLNVSYEVRTQLIKDFVAAKFDNQKLLIAIDKNLKCLVNEFMKANNLVDSSQFKFLLNKVYGYVIYNKSNSQVQYDKISYKTGEKIGVGIIGPCESVALSCAETAMLLSKTTLNGNISNAVLKEPSRKTSSKIEWRNCAMLLATSNAGNAEIRYKDISQIPYSQWDRFLDGSDLVNKVNKIFNLVYRDIGDIPYRQLCEELANNCELSIGAVEEMISEGIIITLLKYLGIDDNEYNLKIRRDRHNNINADIQMKNRKSLKKLKSAVNENSQKPEKQSKGLFGMFKR